MKSISIPYQLRDVYGKRTVTITNTEYNACKADAEREKISIGEAWHRLYGKGKQPTPKPAHAKALVTRPKKEVVEDAVLDYPTDCYDMRLIEGRPAVRECMCPNRDRPINLRHERGRYIVDSPKQCGRCRALGNRKEKKRLEPKRKSYREKPKRQSYREAKVDWGNSEGISAFDIRDPLY